MEQGTLTATLNDGTILTYTGGILNGMKHGKGKIECSGGAVIHDGDWANGQPV